MTKTEIIILIVIAAVILLLIFLPGKAKAEGKLQENLPSHGGGGEGQGGGTLPPEYSAVPTLSQKLKVIDPDGTFAVDFGPEGCLTVRKGNVATGTVMPILEVKENFSKCIEPAKMTIVRTAEGWFSLNPAVVQVID